MARDSECARVVSNLIYKIFSDGFLIIPGEVSLQELSRETGFTPQHIGSAYPLVNRILINKGITTRKCGSPVIIQLLSGPSSNIN